jgi:protein CLEC16A
LEKNLLGFFLNILDQKTSKQVKVQLIQTLSILVENIKAQHSICMQFNSLPHSNKPFIHFSSTDYLFSNNHINELIIHKFDFSDEEVLAYYISFLKTLSLKLDKSTIQFFFNEAEQDFPLYTEAIKFFNHEESMIRIAVRTLTLNVYKVEDEAMRKYIINSTAVPYFSNIVWFLRQQCHTLASLVDASTHANRRKLDDLVAEMLDHFYYLHDMFNLGIDSMNRVLSDHFLKNLLIPLFVGSLLGGSSGEERITPVLSLFLLAQVFSVFAYKPLVNALAQALIHPCPPDPLVIFNFSEKPTPPPPLANLTKRTHYSSFRRFSSVPNLESLESMAIKSATSAPPSPSYVGAGPMYIATAPPIHRPLFTPSPLASSPTRNQDGNVVTSDGSQVQLQVFFVCLL